MTTEFGDHGLDSQPQEGEQEPTEAATTLRWPMIMAGAARLTIW